MKKLMGAVLGLALSVTVLGFGFTQHSQEVKEQELEAFDLEYYAPTLVEETVSNVGDGKSYTYEITEINGDEINGVPLDRISSENGGIFLFQSEVSFDVKVGDTISVVWGKYEDEFASIECAVQAEDGSYVPQSFYK